MEAYKVMKTKEWLILNAVKAWMYNYGEKEQYLTPQYQKLNEELHRAYIEQDEVPKRGRPAKRARKKKASSVATIKEEN